MLLHLPGAAVAYTSQNTNKFLCNHGYIRVNVINSTKFMFPSSQAKIGPEQKVTFRIDYHQLNWNTKFIYIKI